MPGALWGGLKGRSIPYPPGLLEHLVKPLPYYIAQRADGAAAQELLRRYCDGETQLFEECYLAFLPFIRVFSPHTYWDDFNLPELQHLLALHLLHALDPEKCVGVDPDLRYRQLLAGFSRGSWCTWYNIRRFHSKTGRADVRPLYSDRYYDSYDAVDDALFFERATSDLLERVVRGSMFRGNFRKVVRRAAEILLAGDPLPEAQALGEAAGGVPAAIVVRIVSHMLLRLRIEAARLRAEHPDVSWERERRWNALYGFDIVDWCPDADEVYGHRGTGHKT